MVSFLDHPPKSRDGRRMMETRTEMTLNVVRCCSALASMMVFGLEVFRLRLAWSIKGIFYATYDC